MKQTFTNFKCVKNIGILLLLTLFISSCNSVKRVKDNEHLLTKNSIIVNGEKSSDPKLKELVVQKPNSKTLGIPLSLYFYNLGNKEKPQTPSEWGKKKPKTYNFIKSIFSEKQSIAFANSMIGLNNWFLRNGQAPVIVDDRKTRRTTSNLKTYMRTQGYFQAKVEAQKDTLGNKKANVSYFIESGNTTYIDTIFANINSPVLDSLYNLSKDKSLLKSGDQVRFENFDKEADRIIKYFRNHGVYHFSDRGLYFEIDDNDTITYRTNVDLNILEGERFSDENGNSSQRKYKIQNLRNVNVFTDYSFSTGVRDSDYPNSTSYDSINFRSAGKLNYNPKLLSESIFVRPGQVYTDTLRNITRQHLKSLRNFKTVSIQYNAVKGKDDELDVDIFLTPIEKYTLGLETELTHSNIRDLGVSGKFSIINRNTFKGAEIFKLSFLGSFFNASQDANQAGNFFNSWEIGSDLSLEVPRLVAPFGLNKLVPKEMSPRTMFTLGTSIQSNIGLDRQTVTGLIDYKWNYNPKKTIQLEIFNTQYVRNLRIGTYFQIYNSEFLKLRDIVQTYDPNINLSNLGSQPVDVMNQIFQDNTFQSSNPKFPNPSNVSTDCQNGELWQGWAETFRLTAPPPTASAATCACDPLGSLNSCARPSLSSPLSCSLALLGRGTGCMPVCDVAMLGLQSAQEPHGCVGVYQVTIAAARGIVCSSRKIAKAGVRASLCAHLRPSQRRGT